MSRQESDEILSIDFEHASLKKSRQAGSPIEEICAAVAVTPDARRAELLAQQNPELRLTSIRAHLLKGNLTEAQEKIEALLNSETNPQSILAIEALYEKSRLMALLGRWSPCLQLCDQVIRLKPSLITHISLLQTRSIAAFEMGALAQSLKDIEMVMSQEKLFPHAVAISFSRVQRIKVLARLTSPENVRPQVQQLWDSLLRDSPLNLENLLILLRLEVDLHRLERKPALKWAQASLLVARALGDRLYEGLALLDSIYSSSPVTENDLIQLKPFEDEYERVRALHSEIRGESEITTTGQSIRKYWAGLGDMRASTCRAFEAQKKILILRYKCLVDCHNGASFIFTSKDKWLSQTQLFLPDGISKEEFFKNHWGHNRFQALLHDGVIRTLIHRLRRRYGLDIRTDSGRLYLDNTFVLD